MDHNRKFDILSLLWRPRVGDGHAKATMDAMSFGSIKLLPYVAFGKITNVAILLTVSNEKRNASFNWH